jgi:hypothetical protein
MGQPATYVEKMREDVRGLPGAQMRGTRGTQICEEVNSNGNGDARHQDFVGR